MIPERANPLAVVEGVLSRFFQATATASAIRHFCQVCSEVQAEKGQRIPCNPPGERELEIVQEARIWHPIPMGADLLCRPPKQSPPLVPDTVLSGTVKGHWTQKGYEEPYGIRGQTVFRPSTYVDFRPLDQTGNEEKFYSPFVSIPRPSTRIGPSMRVFQRACGPPDQAYPDPHCLYVECRSVYRPSAFDLPRVIWGGIVVALADDPLGRGSTDNR